MLESAFMVLSVAAVGAIAIIILIGMMVCDPPSADDYKPYDQESED